jgi:hypothetical protein
MITGPLTAKIDGRVTLVGINSFVFDSCNLRYPNGFARVTNQMSWILANSDAADWQCQAGEFKRSNHKRGKYE